MKFSAILSACLLASATAFAPYGVAAPRYVRYESSFPVMIGGVKQVRKLQCESFHSA